VALVPPWAEGLPPDTDETQDGADETPDSVSPTAPENPEPVAPPARFRDSRTALGNFARTGNNQALRRALGHYVRTGYGGSATMTRRLGGTAAAAGRLNRVLVIAGSSDGAALRDDIIARGNDADAVLDAIIDATSPADGTQDREASRASIRSALSSLLDRYPEADLLALTDEQRGYVIERYTSFDVYARLCLDLQRAVLDKAPDATTGLRRLRYIRQYVAEQVSAAFRSLEMRGVSPSSASVAQITRDALRETFDVFQEYTE